MSSATRSSLPSSDTTPSRKWTVPASVSVICPPRGDTVPSGALGKRGHRGPGNRQQRVQIRRINGEGPVERRRQRTGVPRRRPVPHPRTAPPWRAAPARPEAAPQHRRPARPRACGRPVRPRPRAWARDVPEGSERTASSPVTVTVCAAASSIQSNSPPEMTARSKPIKGTARAPGRMPRAARRQRTPRAPRLPRNPS